MKACVDKDLCIGCGMCCATAEEVFEYGEGYALAKEDVKLEGKLLEKAQEARDNCPTSAISIKETVTN